MKLYRYILEPSDEYHPGRFRLMEYTVRRETTHGYWIEVGWNKKFILKPPGCKRFAYETKKEALWNYIKRTEKYQRILKRYMQRCERGLILANKLKDECNNYHRE